MRGSIFVFSSFSSPLTGYANGPSAQRAHTHGSSLLYLYAEEACTCVDSRQITQALFPRSEVSVPPHGRGKRLFNCDALSNIAAPSSGSFYSTRQKSGGQRHLLKGGCRRGFGICVSLGVCHTQLGPLCSVWLEYSACVRLLHRSLRH